MATEIAANVTLPLRGGMNYHISVDVSEPLDPYQVWAYAFDCLRTFVSWRPAEKVDIFNVTVYTDDVRTSTCSVHCAIRAQATCVSIPLSLSKRNPR
ncbi:hypothetical protein V5799_025300 [Amblyomma americanum]|uniref:Uncharacterized protein n=1 Tax=Amblyomma americanum TaxID=6943 RepID=A0AAQ4E9R0_AMBAM